MANDISADTMNAFRETTILGTLDISIIEASGERVVLEMPVGPKVHQPYGFLHGGASVVLAETAASIGAAIQAGPEFQTFGVEINANHLRTIREGTIRCTGEPIRSGRTIAVWDMRITDEQGRLICVSRCTIAVRPVRD